MGKASRTSKHKRVWTVSDPMGTASGAQPDHDGVDEMPDVDVALQTVVLQQSNNDDDDVGDEQVDEETALTRGKIVQRQKKETKLLQAHIAQNFENKILRLSNRDPDERREKKELKKYVATLQQELKKRHDAELAAFEEIETNQHIEDVAGVLRPVGDFEDGGDDGGVVRAEDVKNMFAHLLA
eukprot:PhM_4_TR18327/c0_g1_i1/m.106891